MCGIVGYIGPAQALPILLESLRRLEYRGYDSAGVAVLNGAVTVVKKAGKLAELEGAVSGGQAPAGTVGMGHTRWATHGPPTDLNAHPHQDCTARVAVIHNGIIENFQELKDRLTKAGHTFASDTDTEVVAHLVEEAYAGDLGKAVRQTVAQLTGAYALVITHGEEQDMIVGVKVSSPLIVGLGKGENLLASDIPAILQKTRRFVPVAENQVVEVRADSVRITDLDGNEVPLEPIDVEWDLAAAEKSGFEDFMLKEIHEQPSAIRDTVRGRFDSKGRLALDDLRVREQQFESVDKVFVVACGTAFHAGLVAKYAIEHWTRLPVEIDIASEFRYRDPVLDSNTLTLAISQSGETIDTLEAVRHARHQQSPVIAITNTVGSSIARESDAVLYTRAGPERGVAASKTFTTQMAALHLLALYLAQVRGTMYPDEISEYVTQMASLPRQVQKALGLDDQIQEIAARYQQARDVLFIARTHELLAPIVVTVPLQLLAYHIAKLRGCDVDQPRNLAKSVTVE